MRKTIIETLLHIANVQERLAQLEREFKAKALTHEQYEAQLLDLQARDRVRVAELRRGWGSN